MQWLISLNPVNKTIRKCHFEREENYRNSVNSRSRPECLPSVYTMFSHSLDTQLHIVIA